MDVNRVICGDALELLKEIPDNSIDLIITDPPYLKEFIPVYSVLAQEAKRLLKDGSYCFAYCGCQFLPEVLNSFNSQLDWFWLFEIKHNGGHPRMWNKRLMVGNKPVICYTKGKPKVLKWMSTLHQSETADKQYHIWGQSLDFPVKIIDCLTTKNSLILDPFMGGGTVGVAAKMLGRNFIGFEIDSEQCKIANDRIEAAQVYAKLEAYV